VAEMHIFEAQQMRYNGLFVNLVAFNKMFKELMG